MKKIFLWPLLMTICIVSNAQTFPTLPNKDKKVQIGTKVVFKLVPTDSAIYDISILSEEPFETIIDMYHYDSLFTDTSIDSVLVCYFCIGTYGKTEKERTKNMKVVLLIKNKSSYNLAYDSEIRTVEYGDFEKTSNVGCFAGATTMEQWPYMIYTIGLSNFRKSEY